MKKQSISWLIAVTLLLTLHNPTGAGNEDASLEIVSTSGDDSYQTCLLLEYQWKTGRIEEAFKTCQKIMALSKNIPPFVIETNLKILFSLGQHSKVTQYYEKETSTFEKLFGDNLDVQLMLAQSYLTINKDALAEKILAKLSTKYHDNEQVAYYTAVSLIQSGDQKKALCHIDKCIKNKALRSRHFLFHFLQSKIFLQAKEYPKALASINESLKKFPHFDRGWLFKAMLLEQQGKITEAISGYKQFLDLSGGDQAVEKQLVQLLFMQKRFAEAAHYLQKIRSDKAEYFFDMALIELRGKQYKQALKDIDVSIAKNPSFRKAYLLKIEILLALEAFDKLGEFMQTWLEENPNDASVINTIFLLRKTKVPTNILITSLEHAVKRNKTSLLLLASLSDFYIDAFRYNDALNLYDKLLGNKLLKKTSHSEIKSQILFHKAYLCYSTNKISLVENLLKQAIACQNACPGAYNLLAYFYAQNNKNLKKALELANQALTAEPMNHYFLDTKGYALLKLGDKKEAATHFRQALQLAPNDNIVKKHLHYALQESHAK